MWVLLMVPIELMELNRTGLAGMMAYKTVPGEKKVQKKVHLTAQLIALVLGIVGVCAAFKFHDKAGIRDMYSLHSWLGIGTISLFGLQVRIYNELNRLDLVFLVI